MEIETINGQIIAKANHYQAVPGKGGTKRIIKDEVIRAYERNFMEQCKVYRNRCISSRFRLFVRVWHSSPRFDLDNSLKRSLIVCKWQVRSLMINFAIRLKRKSIWISIVPALSLQPWK